MREAEIQLATSLLKEGCDRGATIFRQLPEYRLCPVSQKTANISAEMNVLSFPEGKASQSHDPNPVVRGLIGTSDTEFSHEGLKGCSLHAESNSGTPVSADHPIGFA